MTLQLEEARQQLKELQAVHRQSAKLHPMDNKGSMNNLDQEEEKPNPALTAPISSHPDRTIKQPDSQVTMQSKAQDQNTPTPASATSAPAEESKATEIAAETTTETKVDSTPENTTGNKEATTLPTESQEEAKNTESASTPETNITNPGEEPAVPEVNQEGPPTTEKSEFKPAIGAPKKKKPWEK